MWIRSLYYFKKVFDILRYGEIDISSFQDERLNEIFEIAETRDFYEEEWPNDFEIRTKEDLTKLPLMDSEKFRDKQSYMNQVVDENSISKETSGSTGNPVKIKINEVAYDWLSAVYLRTFILQGYRPGRKITQYWREPEENRTWIGKKIMPVNYIDSDNSIEEQIELIEKQDPDVLKYFPQVLIAICKKINADKNLKLNVELVLTYGENITPSMRDYIEETLDAKVKDQYVTTEFGIVAWECPEGGYHINEDVLISEILDLEQNKLSETSNGKIVLTGLVNDSTPLIRYDIGDIVKLSDGSCSCNTSFKRIDSIRGRKENVILNSEGRKIFPDQIVDLIAPAEEILFFKFIAEDTGYRLEYVPNSNFEDEKLDKLIEKLQSDLSLSPMEALEVEEIEEKGGKINILENNQSNF